MRPFIGSVAVLIVLAVSCGAEESTRGGARDWRGASSEPVSVARIRQDEKIAGECRFGADISQYPVTYFSPSEDCRQAVRIGPLGADELEQMKREEPLFWGKSSPYQQALVGQRTGGECEFSYPAVQAFLEFSEIASTDWTNCVMIVDVGPATRKQIEEVQRLGTTKSSTAVPAPSAPVPGR